MPFSLSFLTPQGRKRRKLYKPLDPANQEIRLLTLRPDSEPAWIHCRLEVVSLKDQAPYTAISYVWGTNQLQREIIINSVPVDINDNVYRMLMTLRDITHERTLWIDALCINQEDQKEKAHQVSLMGTIYSNAYRTWIWLGPSSEDSDLAMNLAASAGPGDFERSQLLSKSRDWKALYALMRRAWWSRLWIVQEACLSKRPIVKCGEKEVELKKFRDLYQLHKQFQYLPDRILPNHVRVLFAVNPFAYVLGIWDTAMPNVVKDQGSLSAWLIYTTYARHTLPRDRLFALLSLSSPEDRKAIRVDYQRPDRDVFKEAAMHFIRKNGLISIQAGRVRKSLNFNLPSWAPDWSFQDPPRGIWFIAPAPYEYRADGTADDWQDLKVPTWNLLGEPSPVDGPARFSPNGEILGVRGLIFDQVEFTEPSSLASETHDQLAAAVKAGKYTGSGQNADRTISSLEAHVMAYGKDPYSNTCGRNEAFWRTLIADRTAHSQPTPADYGIRFETFMSRQNASLSTKDKYVISEPWFSRAFACTFERTLIVTKKGYIGLAPPDTQSGDLVCVFQGGNAPFVLRKIDGPYYQLFGDSYIHGIMAGESVRAAKLGDIKEFWIR